MPENILYRINMLGSGRRVRFSLRLSLLSYLYPETKECISNIQIDICMIFDNRI